MLNPIQFPVDYVLLADQRSPGLATIVGAGSPRRWDERDGYGLSGAVVVFRGLKLAKFSVQIRLYSPEDFAAWEAWRPLVARPPLGTRAKALDIWHPFLEELEIKAVVIEDVSQPDQTDDGVWTYTISMLEHRAPKVALAKPEGAKASAVDPVDRYIEELTKQVQQLAAQ